MVWMKKMKWRRRNDGEFFMLQKLMERLIKGGDREINLGQGWHVASKYLSSKEKNTKLYMWAL